MATSGAGAVVFDLDGTLVDTLPDILAALNRTMAEENLRAITAAECRLLVGRGTRVLVEGALALAGGGDVAARIEACHARFLEYYLAAPARLSRPFPGVAAALAALAAEGARLGVCTNKPHAITLKVLEALGLAGRFAAVLGGDALEVRKPDARHLLAVIERLGAAPGAAAMVGDSAIDVETARNAAVPVVVVDFGYTAIAPADLGADAVISDFAALPAALARVRGC